MPTDWANKVRAAITDLQTKRHGVLEPDQSLALIDDVVEGNLAADELAIIHGMPAEGVKITLGRVTRMVQGKGRALPLDAGGWYAFRGYEHPYEVAPGFAAAWKKARPVTVTKAPVEPQAPVSFAGATGGTWPATEGANSRARHERGTAGTANRPDGRDNGHRTDR